MLCPFQSELIIQMRILSDRTMRRLQDVICSLVQQNGIQQVDEQGVHSPAAIMIEFGVAREFVENAFHPLQCSVLVHCLSGRVSFRVYDAFGSIAYASKSVRLSHFCTEKRLRQLTLEAQLELQAMRFRLDSGHARVFDPTSLAYVTGRS